MSLKIQAAIAKGDRLRVLRAMEYCREKGTCRSDYEFVAQAILSRVKEVEEEMRKDIESRPAERMGGLETENRGESKDTGRQARLNIFPDEGSDIESEATRESTTREG